MNTSVAQWGNSLALRIPRSVAEELRLASGSRVELRVEDGRLVVQPMRKEYTLEELLAQCTPDNVPESFDDGPMGDELL